MLYLLSSIQYYFNKKKRVKGQSWYNVTLVHWELLPPSDISALAIPRAKPLQKYHEGVYQFPMYKIRLGNVVIISLKRKLFKKSINWETLINVTSLITCVL